MKYRVTKRLEVSAAHSLDLPYESPCRRQHGHNWIVEVTCESEQLTNGMVIDFAELKRLVHGVLDHQLLNQLEALPLWCRRNPTVEHLAHWILERVPKCVEVTIWESENNRCTVTA